MTTNNNLNNGQYPQQDIEGHVAFHLPRKIPLAILFAFLTQIAIVIWAVSSFYSGQKELQNQFKDNIATLTHQLHDLKSSIYTRNEAVIQFEVIRQENMRQDQEIRELRNKVIHERNR